MLFDEIMEALQGDAKDIHKILKDADFVELTDAYIYTMNKQQKLQTGLSMSEAEYRVKKVQLMESEEYQKMFKTIKARENQVILDLSHEKDCILSFQCFLRKLEVVLTVLKIYIDHSFYINDILEEED